MAEHTSSLPALFSRPVTHLLGGQPARVPRADRPRPRAGRAPSRLCSQGARPRPSGAPVPGHLPGPSRGTAADAASLRVQILALWPLYFTQPVYFSIKWRILLVAGVRENGGREPGGTTPHLRPEVALPPSVGRAGPPHPSLGALLGSRS